jgi:putative membrane protein
MEFLSGYYQEILAFHIIAVMSWMTLVFYMPRLFVYHTENIKNKDFIKVVEVQEEKIYKIIGYPAMWASIVSGGFMLGINSELLNQKWMLAKLIVLMILIAYTISLDFIRGKFLIDTCVKGGQFFRAYNELPTLLAILIVTFVITKSIPIYFSIGISIFFIFIMFVIAKKDDKDAIQ